MLKASIRNLPKKANDREGRHTEEVVGIQLFIIKTNVLITFKNRVFIIVYYDNDYLGY